MSKLPDDQFAQFVKRATDALEEEGFSIERESSIPYGIALHLRGGGILNLYNGKKGLKAVSAGKLLEKEKLRVELVAERLISPLFGSTQKADKPLAKDSGKAASNADAPVNLLNFQTPWIGCDEAGKGDWFGPLVVAAVCVKPDQVFKLADQGIRDSKKLSDSRCMALSGWIEKNLKCASRIVMPEEYNRIYGGNLNEMLAGLHAEVISSLAAETNAPAAISDDFGGNKHIVNALKKRKTQVALSSFPKAERDMAVAAASVLARGLFLQSMKDLSTQATIEIPLGAGPPVLDAGRKLVSLFGAEVLSQYAKLHFKTTDDVLGN